VRETAAKFGNGKHAQHLEETTGDRRLHLFQIGVILNAVEILVRHMIDLMVFDVRSRIFQHDSISRVMIVPLPKHQEYKRPDNRCNSSKVPSRTSWSRG
jgi:hypothetical protein